MGNISEKSRMVKVKNSENQIRFSLPKTAAAAAPATAAPMVLAIVFRVRMAVMGCWIFFFSFFRVNPDLSSRNLIFIGRAEPMKGDDLLMDAFSYLRKEHPKTKLYLLGRGFGKYSSMKNVVVTGKDYVEPMKYMPKCALIM